MLIATFRLHTASLLQAKPNSSAEPANELLLVRFCLMSKVCPNSFAVAYNNKAYVFKSETTLRSQLVRPKDAVDRTQAALEQSKVY